MERGVKTVETTSRTKKIRVEADGCLVVITCGLTNMDGEPVTNISISADQYAGEPRWVIADPESNRRQFAGILVVQRELTPVVLSDADLFAYLPP